MRINNTDSLLSRTGMKTTAMLEQIVSSQQCTYAVLLQDVVKIQWKCV